MTDQARFISGSTGDAVNSVAARSGFLGVTFFFVLSGFVLTWAAAGRPGDRLSRFYRRRAWRIYPNHLVALGFAALLMLIVADPFTNKGIFTHIFLVQTWVPDAEIWKTLNIASWSLGVDLLFYLSFPLLIWLLLKVPARRLWAIAVTLVALTVSVPVFALSVVGGTPLPFLDDGISFEQLWFVFLFPPARLLECMLGMVVARMVLERVWPKIGLLPACLFAVGGYVVCLQVPFLFAVGGAAAVWLLPVLAAAATADSKGLASPFRGRIMDRLGDLTFAFYLLQGTVVAYAFRWFVLGENLSPAAGIVVIVIVFVVSIVLSYALFTGVERPLMRKFSEPKRAPVLAPAPVARELATAKADE